MPLDPKQQPPYYTPATTPSNNPPYSRLYTNVQTIATSGTSQTDLYLYTIPANTLTQIGDTILIQLNGTNVDSGVAHNINFYVDGNQQFNPNENNAGPWTIKTQLIRQSTTQLMCTQQMWGQNNQYGLPMQQTVALLDFTQNIPIKYTGHCPTSGSAQTYNITIDLIKT